MIDRQRNWTELGETARSLYRSGQLEELIDRLRPIADHLAADGLPEPEQGPLLQWLGLALRDLGRPLEAADAIEKAGLVAPLRDEAQLALASCYAKLRRTDLARELYLQLAISRRLSPELMLQAAAGLDAIGSPQLAMQVCEWIIEKDDTVARAYHDMGVYSARSGQPLYMVEALTRRALQLDPESIRYRIRLASLLVQLNRDSEAIEVIGGIEVAEIASLSSCSCLARVAPLLRRRGQPALADACDARRDELRVGIKHLCTGADEVRS